MKLSEVKEYKKDGSYNVKGYKISLSKTGVEIAGFTPDDNLQVEYKENEIIIKK